MPVARVHPSLIPKLAADERILVGSVIGESSCLNVQYLILDGFICEDSDVVSEQVECIEGILPIGLHVLGVSCRTVGGASALASSLADHRVFSTMIGVTATPKGDLVASLLGSKEKVSIVPDVALTFTRVECLLLRTLPSHPLVFCPNTPEQSIVSLESPKTVPPSLFAQTSCTCVQVGSSKDPMLRVPMTVPLKYVSGVNIFTYITDAAKQAGKFKSFVLVQSKKNDAVMFMCKVEDACDGSAALEVAHQMIEDGTGERIGSACKTECSPKTPTATFPLVLAVVALALAILGGIVLCSRS